MITERERQRKALARQHEARERQQRVEEAATILRQALDDERLIRFVALFDAVSPFALRDRLRAEIDALPVETGPPDEVVDQIRERLKASSQPSSTGGFHVKHVGDN